MTNTKKYNELVEKIKELEYWQEIERRRADIDNLFSSSQFNFFSKFFS